MPTKKLAGGKPTYKATGPFSRGAGVVPNVGFIEDLAKDVFALGDSKKLLDRPYKLGSRLAGRKTRCFRSNQPSHRA